MPASPPPPPAASPAEPILVDVWRGDQVESRHRGSVVVVDADNRLHFSLGDVGRAIYPRSAIKPLQALPLVEQGAAQAFALSDAELAFACASHNAESMHLNCLQVWLDRLGLQEADLECGPDWPLGETARHDLIKTGATPGKRHQNCSGKHAGMLTLARHLNLPASGYSTYEHGVQAAWLEQLGELAELDAFALPWERDGCGLPAVCMPLRNLALAYAKFATPKALAKPTAAAANRIRTAISAAPHMIAGSGRCCSAVIAQTAGRLLVKTGAEGVYAGMLPERGLGFALKMDDGATRASEVALGALLNTLGALNKDEYQALKPFFKPDIINTQGHPTGRIAPAEWEG